VTYLRALFETV